MIRMSGELTDMARLNHKLCHQLGKRERQRAMMKVVQGPVPTDQGMTNDQVPFRVNFSQLLIGESLYTVQEELHDEY